MKYQSKTRKNPGKRPFVPLDGPFVGKTLWLQPTGKTLEFNVRDYLGYYEIGITGVKWVPTK